MKLLNPLNQIVNGRRVNDLSRTITLKGSCGKELKGKVWKQGCSVKCPDEWSIIIYPQQELFELQQEVWRCCEGCDWEFYVENNDSEENIIDE